VLVECVRPTLDLRGVPCPLSWVRAKVRLETLRRGEEIDLVLDDPQGARDLPRAAEAAGHHVVEVITGAGVWTITLEA
jgi:sulfite reductase (ferredoxin)